MASYKLVSATGARSATGWISRGQGDRWARPMIGCDAGSTDPGRPASPRHLHVLEAAVKRDTAIML
jgi:hypothetical protein